MKHFISGLSPASPMKTYAIYRHETKGFEAVPVGFSWGAACFQLLWFIYHHMYAYAVLAVVIAAIPLSTIEILSPADTRGNFDGLRISEHLVCAFVLGMVGNDLRRRFLIKRGFQYVGDYQALAEGNAIEDAQKALAIP